MSAPLCPKQKPGGHGPCGTVMVEIRDSIGRLSWRCPRCARRKAGLCADCPRPVTGVVGRAERCDDCRAAARTRDFRNWRLRDIEKARRIARETASRIAWRKRGGPPPDPAVLAVKRGYARAAALSPARRTEIARQAGLARWKRLREQQAVAA